jgi:uncharacterized membrane protein (UPF0127 family)
MIHTPLRGAMAALLLLLACQAPEAQGKPPVDRPASTNVTDKDYVMPPLPKAWVRLKDAFGGVHRVEVEVAATPDSRRRGLMWRTELAEGTGMLFLFPYEEEQGFWMANTLIPLDMVFINSKHQIVGIVERAVPQSRESRSVGLPSQFVLEVPGGWCQSKGITKNSPVEFEGVSSIQIIP